MQQHKRLRSGRILGEGVTNTWDVGCCPPSLTLPSRWDPHASDYSDENEFEWEPTLEENEHDSDYSDKNEFE